MNESRDEWMARMDRQNRITFTILSTVMTCLGIMFGALVIQSGAWPLAFPVVGIAAFWWWFLGRKR